MKIIHCSLWGDIEISDLAISIIDTPHFQRLHYIKQTGFSYKVFPGAHTSRFEHSVGVYGTIRTLLDHLMKKQPELANECDARQQELICIAGLVHDMGHGPFSHFFDAFLEKIGVEGPWADHESRGMILLRDIVEHHHVDLSETELLWIEKLVKGTGDPRIWTHQIVNNGFSGLDMDKMDYVLRDSTSFGMKIHFDPVRIIKNSRVIEGELCFCDRVQDEIITVFLIRNKMNRFIYRHKKIIEFENIVMEFLCDGNLFKDLVETIRNKEVEKYLGWNDSTLLFRIPAQEYSDFECRKKKAPHFEAPHYEDKTWEKIKNLRFYKKKNPEEKIAIQDWKIVSCF